MAEFNAGLQTQQEERYVISLFVLLLGGSPKPMLSADFRAAHQFPVADRNRSLGCLMIMITVPK